MRHLKIKLVPRRNKRKMEAKVEEEGSRLLGSKLLCVKRWLRPVSSEFEYVDRASWAT